jgi:hypothetical protein
VKKFVDDTPGPLLQNMSIGKSDREWLVALASPQGFDMMRNSKINETYHERLAQPEQSKNVLLEAEAPPAAEGALEPDAGMASAAEERVEHVEDLG